MNQGCPRVLSTTARKKCTGGALRAPQALRLGGLLQEHARAPRLLVVEDAVGILERLELLVPARHPLLVRHPRVSNAARQELLPRLHCRIEQRLLSAELIAGRAEVVHHLRELSRGGLQRVFLRCDGHLGLALVLNEITLGLLLSRCSFLDRPLEVTHDNLHHAKDAGRGTLGRLVRVIEAGVRRFIIHGRLLHERLRRRFVEVIQDINGLLDRLQSLLSVGDGLLVLCLLLRASCSLVLEVLLKSRNLFRQLGLGQVQLLLTSVRLLDAAVQIRDIPEAVVTVLQRLRNFRVAPALVVGFVSLLLQEALNQLLDHPLDLLEGVVLRDLQGKRGQDRALELLPCRRQQRYKLLPLRSVFVRNHQLTDQLLLHERNRFDFLGLGLVLLLAERATTLTSCCCLLRYGTLKHRERLRERRELISPHLRALVPELRLGLALLGEILQVNAVVVKHSGRLGQVSLRSRNLFGGLRLLLLLVLEGILRLLELIQLCLHRHVVVAVGGLVVRLERGLPLPERAKKPLEGLDDASRMEVVIARRDVSDGLILRQKHGDDLPALRRHIHGVGHEQAGPHDRLDLGEAHARRRLQRLDRALQRGDCLLHVRERRVERGNLLF